MALEQVSPNSANYMRGGTRVYVKRNGESNWVHLGNIVNVSVSRDEDVQEHITGIDGSRVVDRKRQDVKSVNYTIQLDESTRENVRMWMLGGSVTNPTQAATVGNAAFLDDLLVGGPTALEAGRYYNMRIDSGSSTHNKLWDSNEKIVITGKTEGTDFVVDYVAGRIVFMDAVADTTTLPVTGPGKLLAITATQSYKFNQFAAFRIDVSAEGVHSFEDGKIRDFWSVPKAQLLPSGDGSFNIESDRVIELQLVQLKDSLLGWGTYERVDLG